VVLTLLIPRFQSPTVTTLASRVLAAFSRRSNEYAASRSACSPRRHLDGFEVEIGHRPRTCHVL